MVPIRFIAEAFGLEVNWDQGSQTAFVGDTGPTVKVHFLDVGQADSILVQFRNSVNMLVDGGNDGAGSSILSYLATQNVGKLDYAVATHPDSDHIGALDEIGLLAQ